jgi:mRNA-degrading endonuclease YafQ of YafQ-DinJ toxin-antitoxin module
LRKIKVTDNYKNDLKRIRKRGWNEKSLTKIIKALQRGGKIPAKLNDHPLIPAHLCRQKCISFNLFSTK